MQENNTGKINKLAVQVTDRINMKIHLVDQHWEVKVGVM